MSQTQVWKNKGLFLWGDPNLYIESHFHLIKKKGNIIWTFWYDLTKSEQNVLDTNSGTLRIHSSISHSVQIPFNIWWEKKKQGLGHAYAIKGMKKQGWGGNTGFATHCLLLMLVLMPLALWPLALLPVYLLLSMVHGPAVTSHYRTHSPSPSESWVSRPLSPPGILQAFPLFLGTQKIL